MYASEHDWFEITKFAIDAGMVWAVPESEALRGSRGDPVHIGAMGVGKVRKERVAAHQSMRCVSIVTPMNEHVKRLPGDTEALSYLGHMSVVVLGGEEELVLDAEDFEPLFNLFYLPD